MLGTLGQHGPTRAVIISDPVEQRPSADLQGLELRWGAQQRMPDRRRCAHWRTRRHNGTATC